MRFWFVILAVSIGAFGLSGCSAKGNVFSLKVGDCFNSPPTGEVGSVDRASCSEPHQFEVYATFNLTGSSWPGKSTVQQQAGDGCLSRFASYIGIGYEYSEWYGSKMYPTQDSWNRGDDRGVTCLVRQEYGMTVGSARGTRR